MEEHKNKPAHRLKLNRRSRREIAFWLPIVISSFSLVLAGIGTWVSIVNNSTENAKAQYEYDEKTKIVYEFKPEEAPELRTPENLVFRFKPASPSHFLLHAQIDLPQINSYMPLHNIDSDVSFRVLRNRALSIASSCRNSAIWPQTQFYDLDDYFGVISVYTTPVGETKIDYSIYQVDFKINPPTSEHQVEIVGVAFTGRVDAADELDNLVAKVSSNSEARFRKEMRC